MGGRDDLRRCGSVLGIAEYHPRPIAGEALHDCSADSTGSTSHQRLPTCECAITVPGRLARSARRLTLHLPTGWPWQAAWEQLATAANSPPLAA